jgi:hypothetical protein
MTSAYLHTKVEQLLAGRSASINKKQELATIVHLCGAERGEKFVKRGFRFIANEKCGSHSLKAYVERVQSLKSLFSKIYQGDKKLDSF